MRVAVSDRNPRLGGKVQVKAAKTSISIEYPITHLGLGDVEDTQLTDRSVHAGETGTTMRIIVTGGNSGIGKATAGALAAAGHSVVIACRTIPKAEQAAAEMAGDVEVRHLDLADLPSVRRFADSVESVDVLVNNAGVMSPNAAPHRGRLRATHGHQLSGPFRIDVPARQQDQRPGHIGGQRELHVRPHPPRRPQPPSTQALDVGRICGLQAGHHALRRRVGQSRRPRVRGRSGGADTDIIEGQHRLWGWMGRALEALAFLAQDPSRRGPIHYPGGDDRPAERDVYRAALPQTHGHSPR